MSMAGLSCRTSGKSTSTEGHSQQMSEGSAMGNTATERLTTPVEGTCTVLISQ